MLHIKINMGQKENYNHKIAVTFILKLRCYIKASKVVIYFLMLRTIKIVMV